MQGAAVSTDCGLAGLTKFGECSARRLSCFETVRDATWRPPAGTKCSHVYAQLNNRATQCVAMQPQFGRRPGDVSIQFLQHNGNKGLLEFADPFAI